MKPFPKKNATLFLFAIFIAAKGFALEMNDHFEPQCYFENSNCKDTFEFGADWLYWKMNETNLAFGTDTTLSGGPLTTVVVNSLDPNFEYNSGFRIFARYMPSNCSWDFRLEYTHMPSRADKNFNFQAGNNFATLNTTNFPLLGTFASGQFRTLDSNWESNLDYVDIDISRSFTCCEGLFLIPHIGIRNFWFNQTYDIDGIALSGLILSSTFKSNIYAVGVEGGIKGSWKFCRWLSLIGNVGGSLLYARYNDKSSAVGVSTTTTAISSRGDRWRGIPMFDAFVGLQYDACIYDYLVNIHAGWEQHLIIDTNSFSQSRGNLSTQGLTLGASIYY